MVASGSVEFCRSKWLVASPLRVTTLKTFVNWSVELSLIISSAFSVWFYPVSCLHLPQTKHLPPWMFSQWFDRLLNALLEGAARLVADILIRVAQRYSQALALPFRVLVTSVCDWDHDGRSFVERFTAKLIEDGKGDALSIFTQYA